MNSKLIKACVAGTAAIAVGAGGTTFAAWSDFSVDAGNAVGADTLALIVDDTASRQFDDGALAPGEARDYAFYVASRTGTTADATLNMTIKDLVGSENDCDSNSEASDETNGAITDKDAATAPCNVLAGNEGQFPQQTAIYVQADEVADPALCNGSYASNQVLGNKQFASMEDVAIPLLGAGQVLSAGEGVCVFVHLFMPANTGDVTGVTVDNASQGDTATFDVRFDLIQAL